MAYSSALPDLWGRIGLNEDDLFELIYNGRETASLHGIECDAVRQFNTLCRAWDKPEQQIGSMEPPALDPEAENARRIDTWFIPEPFADLDVLEAVLDRCQRDEERDRVRMEVTIFVQRGLLDLIRMMFALVDHFRRNNTVWGVGRGSSVASYTLFLIGVHKVDSLRYGLDFSEFIKPGQSQDEPWKADDRLMV